MSFDFNNDTPIYVQIAENIKLQIINKNYLPGDRLPSVRDLSLLYTVNPNTVQKALGELEGAGLIVTERTNGKFVTTDEKIIATATEQTINGMIDGFFSSMASLGFTKEQIIEIITKKE